MRILDILRTEIGFDRTFVVTDVGSGTGLLSELFLANGNHVIGVEPNDDMRIFAEKRLGKFPKEQSVRVLGLQKSIWSQLDRRFIGSTAKPHQKSLQEY